jgi:hypothetical protein
MGGGRGRGMRDEECEKMRKYGNMVEGRGLRTEGLRSIWMRDEERRMRRNGRGMGIERTMNED